MILDVYLDPDPIGVLERSMDGAISFAYRVDMAGALFRSLSRWITASSVIERPGVFSGTCFQKGTDATPSRPVPVM